MGNGIRFQERRLHLARTQQVETSARRIASLKAPEGLWCMRLPWSDVPSLCFVAESRQCQQPTRGGNNISSGRVRRMFNSAHSLFSPWTDSEHAGSDRTGWAARSGPGQASMATPREFPLADVTRVLEGYSARISNLRTSGSLCRRRYSVPVATFWVDTRPFTLSLMFLTLSLIELRSSTPLAGASNMPAPTPSPTPAAKLTRLRSV
jgi:hypothetical protein